MAQGVNYSDVDRKLVDSQGQLVVIDNANIEGDLDSNARVAVRVNTGVTAGVRRRINLVAGSGITLSASDDSNGEEVDVTVATTGGGGDPAMGGDLTGTASNAQYAAGSIELADVNNSLIDPAIGAGLRSLSALDLRYEELGAASTVNTALTNHLNDTSDAHDASAISIADAGNDFTATDVEGALAELQSDHETDAQNLTDHIGDPTDAHDASAISYAGGTGMSATDVEAAIDELANEKLDIADNLSDVANPRAALNNIGAGAIAMSGLCYVGHSWTAGIGVATTGTPRFQRQGFMGRLAAMLQIPETNLKAIATAGGYMIRTRSVYTSPYQGWAGVFAFLGPYSSPNFGDPTATIPDHPVVQQPWPLLICHGINDAAYYGSSTTSVTHSMMRNAWVHALRGTLSKHRSGNEWGSYYDTSGAAAWRSGLTFSGTWSNQTVNPSSRTLSGASGPFRKASSTTNDYVEFTIPSEFKGGTIAVSFVSQMNGKQKLKNASGINSAVTSITVEDGSSGLYGYSEFPDSGDFRIKIDDEEMLVTAGEGTTTWTVTRGHNGTTAASHSLDAEITMPTTGLLVTWSTNGSNATITGTTNLQSQGYAGHPVCVVKRFACTAADAGKTIRATISGIVSGDTHTLCQFDAVWLESNHPSPAVIETVPRWLASGLVNYTYVTAAQYGDMNTDIDTVIAEFDDRVQKADIDGAFRDRSCWPNDSMPSSDSGSQTYTVTPNNPTVFNAMGTGWVITRYGEDMLVTGITDNGNGTSELTVTRGFNGTTKQNHTTLTSATQLVDFSWMATDRVHPNALGHAVRASIIYDAFGAATVGYDDYENAIAVSASSQDEHQSWFGITDNWYYQHPVNAAITANTTFTKDKLWYFPIYLVERAILVSVGIVTGTSAGTATNARFGLWAPGINRSIPSSLIRELGTTPTTSTTTAQEVATHVVLEPGLYWVGVVNQGTTAGGVRTVANTAWIPLTPVYRSTIDTSTSFDPFYAETGVTGAFSAMGGGTGAATPVIDAGPMPFVWVKFRKPPYL